MKNKSMDVFNQVYSIRVIIWWYLPISGKTHVTYSIQDNKEISVCVKKSSFYQKRVHTILRKTKQCQNLTSDSSQRHCLQDLTSNFYFLQLYCWIYCTMTHLFASLVAPQFHCPAGDIHQDRERRWWRLSPSSSCHTDVLGLVILPVRGRDRSCVFVLSGISSSISSETWR